MSAVALLLSTRPVSTRGAVDADAAGPLPPDDYPDGVDNVFDGEEFQIVKASRVGGVTLECWRNYGNPNAESELLIEALWEDETRAFRVRTASTELPFSLWQAFIAEAARLVPTAAERQVVQ